MSYNGMATPVKQFYTEASSTLRTLTGGATVVGGICMLKGVTINAGAANCSIKIFDGSDNTGTLRYQFRGLAAANEVYQEYIAATGIKFDAGMYIEFQTGGGLGATTSVQVIWQ